MIQKVSGQGKENGRKVNGGSRQKQSEWKNVESGLWGQWIGQGYVCRLSNGELKEITDIKTPEEYNHFLIFDNHNKYFELTLDQNMCKTMTVGTYLVDGDHVARGTEFSKITINSNGILDFVFYGVPCAM